MNRRVFLKISTSVLASFCLSSRAEESGQEWRCLTLGASGITLSTDSEGKTEKSQGAWELKRYSQCPLALELLNTNEWSLYLTVYSVLPGRFVELYPLSMDLDEEMELMASLSEEPWPVLLPDQRLRLELPSEITGILILANREKLHPILAPEQRLYDLWSDMLRTLPTHGSIGESVSQSVRLSNRLLGEKGLILFDRKLERSRFPRGLRYLESLARVALTQSSLEDALRLRLSRVEGKAGFLLIDEDVVLMDSDGRMTRGRLVDGFQLSMVEESLRAAFSAWQSRGKRGYPLFEESSHEGAEGGLKAFSRSVLSDPIRAHIRDLDHLVVQAPYDISAVPYSLLPFDDGVLGDQVTISISPSILDLLDDKVSEWDNHFENPLVVGNPSYPNESELSSLSGAEEEAVWVAGSLDTDPLTGPDASLVTVKQRAAVSDLLYLATHGFASRRVYFESYLALSAAEGGEWRWKVEDIQSSPLRARLAVLSACETGSGLSLAGGLTSLARAFHKAGVPRVIMSLWQVDDEGTKALMVEFMKQIRTGLLPHVALREAKLAMRKGGRHSRGWAAFQYFGPPW